MSHWDFEIPMNKSIWQTSLSTRPEFCPWDPQPKEISKSCPLTSTPGVVVDSCYFARNWWEAYHNSNKIHLSPHVAWMHFRKTWALPLNSVQRIYHCPLLWDQLPPSNQPTDDRLTFGEAMCYWTRGRHSFISVSMTIHIQDLFPNNAVPNHVACHFFLCIFILKKHTQAISSLGNN